MTTVAELTNERLEQLKSVSLEDPAYTWSGGDMLSVIRRLEQAERERDDLHRALAAAAVRSETNAERMFKALREALPMVCEHCDKPRPAEFPERFHCSEEAFASTAAPPPTETPHETP